MAELDTAPRRAWKDTKEWVIGNTFRTWLVVGIILGGAPLITAILTPITTTRLLNGVYGFIGAILALVLAVFVVFIYHLAITPIRQRNEARRAIDELKSQIIEPNTQNNNSKYFDQNAEKAISNHWDELVGLCQNIVENMWVPYTIDQRYLTLQSKLWEQDDGIFAILFINHFDRIDAKALRTDWSLYKYLLMHMKAEDSDWENKMERLRSTVSILHEKLYVLSLKANRISKTWYIDLNEDWVTTSSAIKSGKSTAKLRNALIPMQTDTKQAYDECYNAMYSIQRKLDDMTKLRIFKGKCPACL